MVSKNISSGCLQSRLNAMRLELAVNYQSRPLEMSNILGQCKIEHVRILVYPKARNDTRASTKV